MRSKRQTSFLINITKRWVKIDLIYAKKMKISIMKPI